MEQKKVVVLLFHDGLCQVFNGLMTALSMLRAGTDVTVFFGSRGINVVHKEKINNLKCRSGGPEKEGRVMRRMDEMNLPTPEDMTTMLEMEGALLLACPLNKELFEFKDEDIIDGVAVADPETFYTEIMVPADVVLTF